MGVGGFCFRYCFFGGGFLAVCSFRVACGWFFLVCCVVTREFCYGGWVLVEYITAKSQKPLSDRFYNSTVSACQGHRRRVAA